MATLATGRQAAGRDRFRPVIDFMKVRPDDRLLEVGCGNGVSLEMICPLLSSGSITAIDRSAKMTERALQRNQLHVENGRARILTAALANLQTDEHFDKVFALNVNVFWIGPAKELQAIRHLLAPGGSLFLFYQPPAGSNVETLQEKLRCKLADNAFTLRRMAETRGNSIVTSCIEAAAE